jgi:GNAT superfamily N-acetyltransferase
MIIRGFQPEDTAVLEEVLIAAGALLHPEIDGQEAMLRVHACSAAIFLVAEENGIPVGLIRGVYDGSRALIHLLAVHPDYQGQGIGTVLVQEIAKRFSARGAPSLGVTAAADSIVFWKRLTFQSAVEYMIASDIKKVFRDETQRT